MTDAAVLAPDSSRAQVAPARESNALLSGFGAFVATLLILMFGGLLAIFLLEPEVAGSAAGFAILAALVVGWALWDVPYALRLWLNVCDGNHPAVLAAAERIPRRGPLRSVVETIWWGAHFLVGLSAIVFSELADSPAESSGDRVAGHIAVAVLSFGYSFAANGFLAMAVGAATGRVSAVHRVWRIRIWIDLGVMLLVLALLLAGVRVTN